jgi:putative DNA primase/helicase
MLKLAATDPAVAVTPAALDQDPFLFNVENGTIDLRTGKLRPHERHDLLTKLAPVVYHPGAKSTLWMDFLRSAVPSPRRRAYLQQVCGYLLTGVTSEDKVFILHGPGGTGKTTFTEAFKAVLGDYAMATPVATLAKATTGKVRNDLARLTGARMVTASESERFEVVAEALLKLLSGGDTITARFMFKEFFEFLPQFKLVIVTNDFPRLSCDSGVRRRVVRIGFDRPVPARERDAELKRKLRDDPEERAAILAWAVEGCLAWQEKKRLHEPWSIRTGTRLFRPDSYDVAPFVTERCMLNRAAVEPVANLFAAYEVWAAKERRPTPARGRKYRPLGRNDFKAALEAAGLEQRKVNKGSTVRVWRGVRLR